MYGTDRTPAFNIKAKKIYVTISDVNVEQRSSPEISEFDEFLLTKLGGFYPFVLMVGGFAICVLLSLISFWLDTPSEVKQERFYNLAIIVAFPLSMNLLLQVRRGLNSSVTIGVSNLINGFILYFAVAGTVLSTRQEVKIMIAVVLTLLVIINTIISATIKGRIEADTS